MIYMILINLRECFINIFNKKILFIENKLDNKIINNNIYLHYINFLYNNKIGNLEKHNINLVYKLDNIIFFEDFEKKHYNVSAVIYDLQILDTELNVIKEMGDIIKQYSLNIPIYVILELENIDLNTRFKFKVMKVLSIKEMIYDTENIKNKRIYELL
jgi:hypothetical protein